MVVGARVFADDLPGWAGPVLLLLGSVCWTFATPLLLADPVPAPSSTASPPHAATTPTPEAPEPASRLALAPSPDASAEGDAEPEPEPESELEVVVDPEPAAPCVVPLNYTFATARHQPELPPEEEVEAFLLRAQELGGRIIVEGYADQTGDPDANLKLSHDRAVVVRDILVRLGIARESVLIQAFGEYRPPVSANVSERRAVVRLESVPSCEESPS